MVNRAKVLGSKDQINIVGPFSHWFFLISPGHVFAYLFDVVVFLVFLLCCLFLSFLGLLLLSSSSSSSFCFVLQIYMKGQKKRKEIAMGESMAYGFNTF